MVIFERLGGWGLGNSLFQISTAVGMAKDNNTTYGFPINCNYKRVRYGDDSKFKHELPWVDMSNIAEYTRWGTGAIKYVEPPRFNQDVVIDGFFQSEKYFKHVRKEILELFQIKDELKEKLLNDYSHLINDDNTCVISFRRGMDYHKSKEMRVIDMDFYKKAISIVGEDSLFVVFSDDLEWCRENLGFIKNKVFVTANDNVLDLHLMSYFKRNIIANSTFSWWGAWLGDNVEVYMPDPFTNWFSDIYYQEHSYNKNFDDLKCENWITL